MDLSYSRRVRARKLLAKEKVCSKLGHFLRGKTKVSYHADYLIFFGGGCGEDPGGQLIDWIEKFLTTALREVENAVRLCTKHHFGNSI